VGAGRPTAPAVAVALPTERSTATASPAAAGCTVVPAI